MPDDNRIDPQHQPIRDTLRVVGPLLLGVGVIFMIVGYVDFFRRSGDLARPRSSGASLWAARFSSSAGR